MFMPSPPVVDWCSSGWLVSAQLFDVVVGLDSALGLLGVTLGLIELSTSRSAAWWVEGPLGPT
jgi:hypothetical protein